MEEQVFAKGNVVISGDYITYKRTNDAHGSGKIRLSDVTSYSYGNRKETRPFTQVQFACFVATVFGIVKLVGSGFDVVFAAIVGVAVAVFVMMKIIKKGINSENSKIGGFNVGSANYSFKFESACERSRFESIISSITDRNLKSKNESNEVRVL